MKTVSQMSGEEIAKAIAQQYEQLIQAQNNIQILRVELEKRNGKTKSIADVGASNDTPTTQKEDTGTQEATK